MMQQNQKSKFHRKFLLVGPGGVKCACCFPAPGKSRKPIFREIKRKEQNLWRKEIEKELE